MKPVRTAVLQRVNGKPTQNEDGYMFKYLDCDKEENCFYAEIPIPEDENEHTVVNFDDGYDTTIIFNTIGDYIQSEDLESNHMDDVNSEIINTEERADTDICENEKLILAVSKRPVLYDHRISLCERPKHLVHRLWKEVHHETNSVISVDNLAKKFKNLRDRYIHLRALYNRKPQSGSEGKGRNTKKWKYFDSMSFIGDTLQPRATISNLNIDDTEDIEMLSSEVEQTPSTSTNTHSSKKRKTNEHDDIEVQILEELKSNKLDAVDHFCMSLASELRSLPPNKRLELEINFMQQIYEEKYNND